MVTDDAEQATKVAATGVPAGLSSSKKKDEEDVSGDGAAVLLERLPLLPLLLLLRLRLQPPPIVNAEVMSTP